MVVTAATLEIPEIKTAKEESPLADLLYLLFFFSLRFTTNEDRY